MGGTDARTGSTFFVGENIFGPFENGFGVQQDGVLRGLGCTEPSVAYVQGGIDTFTTEQMIAHACGVTLPRIENGIYIALLDECGGHTSEYHFHESLACLYDGNAPRHSPKVGEAEDTARTALYGKWEDRMLRRLPALDACNGHFGVTPDSNGELIYHHHVSGLAPFTIGCFGPAPDADGYGILVSLAACRALYSDVCGDGDTISIITDVGTNSYDPWCPCFSAGTNYVPAPPPASPGMPLLLSSWPPVPPSPSPSTPSPSSQLLPPPASPAVENIGDNCWIACDATPGACEWCGTEGACCRSGAPPPFDGGAACGDRKSVV